VESEQENEILPFPRQEAHRNFVGQALNSVVVGVRVVARFGYNEVLY
jgi:hypothetical protein